MKGLRTNLRNALAPAAAPSRAYYNYAKIGIVPPNASLLQTELDANKTKRLLTETNPLRSQKFPLLENSFKVFTDFTGFYKSNWQFGKSKINVGNKCRLFTRRIAAAESSHFPL